MIGIQKISDLTKFHPVILSKILKYSIDAVSQEKSSVGLSNAINMLQVSENFRSRYLRIRKSASEKLQAQI